MFAFACRCSWLLVCSIILVGCSPPDRAKVVAKTTVVSTEAGVIELSDPKVTLHEGDLVKFEVNYRFTKGKPDRHYMCDISFPGTKNLGVKPMGNWELKSEGIIKDSVTLHMPPVESFEIKISEAVTPQDGYKQISNVVAGKVN